jgi:hypothetical protein
MEQEDREQLLEARKRAVNNGKIADTIKAAVVKSFLAYVESGKEIPPKLMESFLNISMRLEDRHTTMFGLSKHEQSQLELQYARLDVELVRLEAAQPPPASEQGGSNLIEALNIKALEVWGEADQTDRKTN